MATTTQNVSAGVETGPAISSTRRLSALYEISKILAGAQAPTAAFPEVLTVVASYVGLGRCTVTLMDRAGSAYVAASTDRSLESGRSNAAAYPHAVASDVQRANMPAVVTELPADDRFAGYGRYLGEEAARSAFLCVPVRFGGQAVGALSADRPAGARATLDEDLRLLRMVANLIAQNLRVHGFPAQAGGAALPDGAAAPANPREERANRAPKGRGGESGGTDRVPAFNEIVCESAAMAAVLDQVRHVSRTRAPVMLRGESGTGKEMIAHWIHRFSPRREKAFIGVNCAALPESLLESELFGHEKGAFTGANAERKGRFEAAHGGTLFLDEIGEISHAFQAKLLRVLQEGQFERLGSSRTRTVDVRIIASTNRNLEQAVVDGDFRADLYYRINVITILVPPLRERPEDVGPLARHFLERFNQENGDNLGLADDAVAALTQCPFPGNVRELENCVTRVAAMARGATITADDFPCGTSRCLASALWGQQAAGGAAPGGIAPPAWGAPNAPPAGGADPNAPPGDGALDGQRGGLIERERLLQAMEKAGWVQAKAARLLGLTPRQVRYALYKHGIELKRL